MGDEIGVWLMRSIDPNWRPPTSQQVAYATGKIHRMPPAAAGSQWWWMRETRARNFHRACLAADPEVEVWPEFSPRLMRCGLDRALAKGTVSIEVAAILVAQNNRSVGPWLRKEAWLRRRGKDPHQSRRYRRAMREFGEAVMEARHQTKLRWEAGQAFAQTFAAL